MPVFDFNNTPEKGKHPECTYTTFHSEEGEATPDRPILYLDNSKRQWQHHSCGIFTNPVHRTSFEFKEEQQGEVSADILKIDARFVSLIRWLGENRIVYVFPARTGKRDTRCTGSVRRLSEEERSSPRRTDSSSL